MAVVITGILTTLIISRAIIEGEGLAENGIYTMALKVATVYLGALSASAAGYYLPSLSAARKDEDFFDLIDRTLCLYMYIIPPIALVLMAGGEFLMRILFVNIP